MTITKRDKSGKILPGGKALSSEEAAAMGKRSHLKRGSETANKILAEAGFDDDKPAPEHLQVLADYAVSGKSGAVVALRDFRRLTSTEEAAAGPVVAVKPGHKCPTCHQYVLKDMEISDDQLDNIIEVLDL